MRIQTLAGWRLDLLQGRNNDLIGRFITAAGSRSFVLKSRWATSLTSRLVTVVSGLRSSDNINLKSIILEENYVV
jgi:hypothetical protein